MPETPPRGTTLLSELAPEDAREVVSSLGIERHRGRLRALPGVWDVEAGYKTTNGVLHRVEGTDGEQRRQLCLKVFVHRKGHLAGGRRVPKWVTVATPGHGRVAIPTDVEAIGHLVPEANTGVVSPEARSTRPDGQADRGSACCVLTRDGKDYLLTAAHVVENLAQGTPVRWSGSGLVGEGDLLRGNNFLWMRKPSPGGGDMLLDAGLVRIRTPGPYNDRTLYPWGDRVVSWGEVLALTTVTILGKHGAVAAEFYTRFPAGMSINTSKGPLPYWRLAVFHLPGTLTRDGDSGAPLIADGRLVGMHVVRRYDPEYGRTYSLALCSGDLLAAFAGSAPGLALRP